MEVQVIPREGIDAYAALFWRTFIQNADRLRLDFLSKISGTSEIHPIPLGCYHEGKLVAATTIFPITFEGGKQNWLGGQIGDALVSPPFRGKGLFNLMITEAQNIAAKEGYDFLFTFPSINNPGSYKSFLKNNWEELYSMSHFEFHVKSNLVGRVLRKINDSFYFRFEEAALPKEQHTLFDPEWRKKDVYAKIDASYFGYKQYLKNSVVKLQSGLAFVSIGKFTMTLSHFELAPSKSFDDLLEELLKLAGRLAKDTFRFYVAPAYAKQFLTTHSQEKDQHMKAMVFRLNEDLELDRINFIGSDIDTF